VISWRIDHGWYLVRRPRPGEPPEVGPTLYRAATDAIDRLLPEPAQVATWLRAIAHGDRPTGTTTPVDPILAPDQEIALVSRLRRHLLRSAIPRSDGVDDHPLPQLEVDQ
jgi:hypothetical protein